MKRTAAALGTKVSITAMHGSRDRAERAVGAAFGALDQVEQVMSLYRPQSQLCRLNRERVLDGPEPGLVAVLRRAQELARRTGGAFDVTVQPLWEARARGGTGLPAARASVDWRRLHVSRRRIRLAGDGMAVTLNGIAQGYAADRALAALRAHGIERGLVDTGELGGMGRPWTVGIQHPRRTDAYIDLARLDGRCMATSGDYAPASPHIFDPRTGRTPDRFSSVTVVARSGLDADALSTALFVLDLERGIELLASTRGAEAFLVTRDGRTLATRGFPRASA